MNKEQVKQIFLSDGNRYSGWGYFKNISEFTPHGCGKKYYKDYYAYGNFNEGVLNGPAIVSHDYYMNTCYFKDNRGNGWGLCINGGELVEFGYYKDSALMVNLTDFALWYYQKMQAAKRNEDMLSVYTYNETHDVAEILIGYRGTASQNGVGLCYMGFHFMSDGSVWIGNTATRRFTGTLIHFRNDGCIDCGKFDNGNLLETMDIQAVIDDYYCTWSFNDDDLFSNFLPNIGGNPIREKFRNIPSIRKEYNYFSGSCANKEQKYSNTNKYTMTYHVNEVDFLANGHFQELDEESWIIGDKSIITPHGVLSIEDALFVNQGSLVGVQFSVNGTLKLDEFSCSIGLENEVEISTFALMRQPNNVWLWVYAFDRNNNPVVNFCGHDDLDGLAKFILELKRVYR